jgi:positive regulator of sigma E activity
MPAAVLVAAGVCALLAASAWVALPALVALGGLAWLVVREHERRLADIRRRQS